MKPWFPDIPWTVEDWVDFYYTLEAFRVRLLDRHQRGSAAESRPMQTDYNDGSSKFREFVREQFEHDMEDQKVKRVSIHKPGSSVIVKGTEYVFTTEGKWRNQTTAALVDDPTQESKTEDGASRE